MNRKQRMEEAARWYLLCRDEAHFDELQRHEFNRWLQCSIKNVAAYIAVEKIHAQIAGRPLAQRAHEASSDNSAGTMNAGSASRMAMSRRRVIKALAAGVSGLGITAALTSVIDTRWGEDGDSDHVRRVRLDGGVMYVARNTAYSLDRRSVPQTVHLHSGQAALHLWETAGATALVISPLGNVIVAAARVSIIALESMLSVAVAKGSARVTTAGAHASEVVRAGHKLILRSGDAQAQRIELANPDHEIAWATQGDLYFRQQPFGEAAATLNRFNELQIVPSPTVAQLIVGTHQCPLNDPEGFVDLFALDWQLDTRREGKQILIFERNAAPGAR